MKFSGQPVGALPREECSLSHAMYFSDKRAFYHILTSYSVLIYILVAVMFLLNRITAMVRPVANSDKGSSEPAAFPGLRIGLGGTRSGPAPSRDQPHEPPRHHRCMAASTLVKNKNSSSPCFAFSLLHITNFHQQFINCCLQFTSTHPLLLQHTFKLQHTQSVQPTHYLNTKFSPTSKQPCSQSSSSPLSLLDSSLHKIAAATLISIRCL